MLKVLAEKSTPTLVVVECGGKLTTDDYDALGVAVDAAIEAGGGAASAVFVMSSSPSDADWAAFKDDWKFGTHQYRKLSRVAYVGDERWVHGAVEAFGWITKAEEMTFGSDDLDIAIAWAGGEE